MFEVLYERSEYSRLELPVRPATHVQTSKETLEKFNDSRHERWWTRTEGGNENARIGVRNGTLYLYTTIGSSPLDVGKE